jgi:hypothetical protein
MRNTSAYAAEDWPTVERLVHDEIARRPTASGTAAAARARLAAYRETGLNEVSLAGLTEPADIRNTLERLQ